MVVYFDPTKGIVDDQASVVGGQQMPHGLDPIGQELWKDKQQYEQRIAAFEQGAAQGKNKPAFAQDPGQFFGELGNIAGNAVTGLATDYMDLAAGLGDMVVQAGALASGKGWDWNQVFDDSDNPWTQWRQSNFEAETEAGQLVSNVVRVGTMLATLPKVGIKGLALAPKLLSKLPAVGGVAGKVAKGLDAADDFLKSSRAIRQTTQLTEAAQGFAKGSAAAKATKIAAADDWLGMTFKQVSQVDEAKTWWRSVQDSTKALTQLTREKGKVRTVAEALGWDAFVAFNVYGEGDASFDETLNDMLADAGLPNVPLLQTSVQDTGLIRKFKQMAEGVATGVALNGLLDMARVYRYSQAFGKASAEEKELIIKAFNDEADDIGRGLARLQLPDQAMPHPDIAMRNAKEARLAELKAGVETERIAQGYAKDLDVAQLMANQQMANDAMGVQPPGQLPTGPWDPNRGPAGLLAPGRVPADPNSPLQNRLAQMEGAASPLNEDPLYQEWLASRAPAEQFMPPSTGENPALQQFTGQGAMPAPSQQGGPDDLAAYKAWLEDKARMPEAEMDPRVQQSLRRLEGIGELAPRQADQAGQLGSAAGIEPVNVQVIGPRPPEPTVTPQTIRNAFYSDMRRVMEQAQELTYQEGPDGVMRSVTELRGTVKQLMPRTRVDAIEYLKMASPQANEAGVISAADSVWMNFITNRGLQEGWASIDPSTMRVKFNRRSAVELDRGEVAMKQAEALDELTSIELFKQRFADQVAGIEGQKNELLGQMDELAGEQENARYQGWLAEREPMNPGSMDPQVQDRLAQMEANSAYDNWEADAAARDAERRAVTAGVEADQIDAAEELRLTQAEQQALSGQLSDEEVVREYLGTTLDSIQAPEVGKAEVGRGWNVYGMDGEVVASSRTKKEAERLAQAELRRSREALLNRARQMEADATDEAMNVTTGNPIYDSDVVGKVTLTEQQIAAVQRYSQAIQDQLRADWEKRTGGQAWININDIKGSKRSFDMTQGEMFDLVDGIKALLQTGEIKGPQARVLRNVMDKMDTSMKLLEPEARAQRFARDISADAQRFLDHGDFC